jgi:hypothetical protein
MRLMILIFFHIIMDSSAVIFRLVGDPGNIQQFNKSGHMPRNTDQGEGFRE